MSLRSWKVQFLQHLLTDSTLKYASCLWMFSWRATRNNVLGGLNPSKKQKKVNYVIIPKISGQKSSHANPLGNIFSPPISTCMLQWICLASALVLSILQFTEALEGSLLRSEVTQRRWANFRRSENSTNQRSRIEDVKASITIFCQGAFQSGYTSTSNPLYNIYILNLCFFV